MTLPDFIYFSMIFNDLIQYSMTFQAWNFDLLDSMTFQVFHDPYEPCTGKQFSVFRGYDLIQCNQNALKLQ